MNVNTLPEEMLARVLKYSKFTTVRKMRKMNERIDKVARRAQISTKVPLERFVFEAGQVYVELHNSYSEKLSVADKTLFHVPNKNVQCLEQWMSVAANSRHLTIGSAIFSDNLFDATTFDRRSYRHLTSLKLTDVKFTASKQIAKEFFKKEFGNLDILRICHPSVMVDNVCNTEMLGKRTWKLLTFTSMETKLGDSFLMEIVPNCELFTFFGNSGFTTTGILKTIQECNKKGNYNKMISLGHVQLGNLASDEIENFFKTNLSGIAKYSIVPFLLIGEVKHLVTCSLSVSYYLPKRWHLLQWIPHLAAAFGIVCLIISRTHYTIDIIIAYWLTNYVFTSYHAFCEIDHLDRRKSILFNMWPFKIVGWLETNIAPGRNIALFYA